MGENFKGTNSETCKECNVTDDENHRMNECPNWKTNKLPNINKVDFKDIYSNNPLILKNVIKCVQGVWELALGNGSMKRA